MTKIIQSKKNGRTFWQEQKNVLFSNKSINKSKFVEIFPKQRYQQIIGFGGAFTEAACFNIMSSAPKIMKEICSSYYSLEGLCYTLGRVVINSCDFSLQSYTYVQEGDRNLSTFDISHEQKYVIPVIKMANNLANNQLKLVASPWSPPAYMKTNDSMLHGGFLKNGDKLLWAKYLARYVSEMHKQNIPIEFLTVQNEPEARQSWESCLYSGAEEADFIFNYLSPALIEEELGGIKILAWDHNRDQIINRAEAIYKDSRIREIVWGLAYHWYVSSDHENLSTVHNKYSDKHLLFTEGCVELNNTNSSKKSEIGSWEHGEYYGRQMINDFNNYCEGWIDWNLVVDEIGGPNHAQNFCEAPIIYNRKSKEIVYNPSFYFIGHFSKYVLPGAVRIKTEVHCSSRLIAVSFLNPNREIVTIIQNEGYKKLITLNLEGKGIEIKLPCHSITTVIMQDKQRR
ncbi:MAG: glycoside hydrolase family 30 protein [Bacilli bacterium]|nr:glycoside hydrolase family 30 protein [Bacilli bacterium]